MIDNLNIKLLTGGVTKVEDWWTKDVNHSDSCFKIYLPLSGEAALFADGKRHVLRPERLNLISGWRVERQECRGSMEVAWLHFVPDSLGMRFVLSLTPPISSWPEERFHWAEGCLKKLGMVFAPYAEEEKLAQRVRPDVPTSLKCELHALILAVLAEATRDLDIRGALEKTRTIERLKPALEFMDAHFIENPSLAKIAEKAFMAPNYFHKVFKEAFETTPFDYMRDKRLNMAKEALAFSNLSVKEIAAKTGYGDAFHFSKDFKKRVGVPPKIFRERSRSERAIENYPE